MKLQRDTDNLMQMTSVVVVGQFLAVVALLLVASVVKVALVLASFLDEAS